ncbi:MAG: hypothetical protein J1E00_05180 [Oscillospiraceae bacterium]|nr:hypothetical protein [Oscillospiraceae bacterium]
MDFYTVYTGKRPVRLSAALRQWAWRVMHGEYGDEAVKNDSVSMDEFADFAERSPLEKYDLAIRQIALKAPLRICGEESIVGSATLGAAIDHVVPARYQQNHFVSSISHLTIRYDKVLREGLNAYQTEIRERLADPELTEEQTAFLHSLESTVESLRIWHGRYLEATKDAKPEVYALLQQVPFSPARNFREAVQSLWFLFAFVRLCGNWPGIGRIDWLLGDYLRRDLESGAIDLRTAREFFASFFVKGCEWIQSNTPPATGDAQHYQNIVLAGIDENGKEIANAVTYLVLDIVEELGISDFPITVRLNRKTPEKLLRKIARVMRHGGGIVAVYNEELVLRALAREGYAPAEAVHFANDGCWEVQIPGKTMFRYMPFDALQLLNRALGLDGEGEIPDLRSIEQVYDRFKAELEATVKALYKSEVTDAYVHDGKRWRNAGGQYPTSVVSLFEDGSIQKAVPYFDLGPVYTVLSPHIGGSPDVANSLYALQKVVFEEKLVSFAEMVRILRDNWEGAEQLRQYVKNRYVYYGNDAEDADLWHARICDDFADMVKTCEASSDIPVKFIPGLSTFGRQINWLPNRSATAFGYRRGDILAGNASPTPGTDMNGATAMIRSYCKTDLEKLSCGAALDIKIFPESLKGENGITALKELMRGFVKLNGYFMQLDTMDLQVLKEAQQHPEQYKTLSVRVSGWNARFVTLNREWQNMIIQRTAQGM